VDVPALIAGVRSVLFMATRAAIRHNPPIRARYERLITAGKPEKVAVIACARALLALLTALQRDRADWTADTNRAGQDSPGTARSAVSPSQPTTPAPRSEEAAMP